MLRLHFQLGFLALRIAQSIAYDEEVSSSLELKGSTRSNFYSLRPVCPVCPEKRLGLLTSKDLVLPQVVARTHVELVSNISPSNSSLVTGTGKRTDSFPSAVNYGLRMLTTQCPIGRLEGS